VNLIDKGFEHLWKAETEKVTVAPLTEMFPNLTVEEAYQIQLKVIEKKVQQGQRIVGKKIGLTSLAMQQLLGVDQPDYGHLLDRMEVKKGQPVPVEGLFKPRIEAEVAFVLKQDLRGPGITIEDVYEATDYIVPSFEVVDSRITNWRIKLADTIADNASSGLFLLGEQKFKLDCEDRGAGRHETIGGVPAGRIDDGGHDPGMQKSVLLSEIVPEREPDGDQSRLYVFQLGAEQRHHPLAAEALMHPLGEIRCLRFKHGLPSFFLQ